jgi:urease accessory protein
MFRLSHFQRVLLAAVAAALAAEPALAHHVMDGRVPATFGQGLLSGLGHPIVGLDHLAALVGAGLVAARMRGGLALPVLFVTAMAAGVAAHLARFDMPFSEALVALSVVALGAAAVAGPRVALGLAAVLFVAAGAVNGYALGESIAGAEPTPLAAYFIGLVAVQAAIATGVALIARALLRRTPEPAVRGLRFAGGAVALVGVAVLALGQIAGA